MLEYGWLDDNNQIVLCNFDEYVKRNEPLSRQLQLFTKNNITVSTVFLGLDHSGDWFETCIFYNNSHRGQTSDVVGRYQTYDAAFEGHYEHIGYSLLMPTETDIDGLRPLGYSTRQLDYLGRKGVELHELSVVDQFTFDMMV